MVDVLDSGVLLLSGVAAGQDATDPDGSGTEMLGFPPVAFATMGAVVVADGDCGEAASGMTTAAPTRPAASATPMKAARGGPSRRATLDPRGESKTRRKSRNDGCLVTRGVDHLAHARFALSVV
jgi:hypothetical protein